MGEFDLIRRFFQRPVRHAVLGVGDDCALLAPQPGMQLAISSDMLVEGRHFFADVDPAALGHKACLIIRFAPIGIFGIVTSTIATSGLSVLLDYGQLISLLGILPQRSFGPIT